MRLTRYVNCLFHKSKHKHFITTNQTRRTLLSYSRTTARIPQRQFSLVPGIPNNVNDYELHRNLASDIKIPEYFNFCEHVIDKWAVSKEVSTYIITKANVCKMHVV